MVNLHIIVLCVRGRIEICIDMLGFVTFTVIITTTINLAPNIVHRLVGQVGKVFAHFPFRNVLVLLLILRFWDPLNRDIGAHQSHL